MGFGEIKKAVNGDLEEPLNYLEYIRDIKQFSKNATCLRPKNRDKFLMLLTNSLMVYGDDTIHSEIYTQLSEEEARYVMFNNQRIGKAFNIWYDTDVFPEGPFIDLVMAGLSSENKNKIEEKFRVYLDDYIDQILTAERGVGVWINSTFQLNSIELRDNCDTLSDIAENKEALETIAGSEKAMKLLLYTDCVLDNWIASEHAMSVLLKIPTASQHLRGNSSTYAKFVDQDSIIHLILTDEAIMNQFLGSNAVTNTKKFVSQAALVETTMDKIISKNLTPCAVLMSDTDLLYQVYQNANLRSYLVSNWIAIRACYNLTSSSKTTVSSGYGSVGGSVVMNSGSAPHGLVFLCAAGISVNTYYRGPSWSGGSTSGSSPGSAYLNSYNTDNYSGTSASCAGRSNKATNVAIGDFYSFGSSIYVSGTCTSVGSDSELRNGGEVGCVYRCF